MRNNELDRVDDPIIRENFRKLNEELVTQALIRGRFTFFEIELENGNGVYPFTAQFKHGLGFTPKDVIPTGGDGVVEWLFDEFDSEYIYCEIVAAVTVRFFLGSYVEGSRS